MIGFERVMYLFFLGYNKYSVLDVKDIVSSNCYWRTSMLINDTSDKELLDLLAASDRLLRSSDHGLALMQDLGLEDLGRGTVVNQKMRVG